MSDFWVPAAACPHIPEQLFVQVISEEQMIVQCFRCKSVWGAHDVPVKVMESVRLILDARTAQLDKMLRLP